MGRVDHPLRMEIQGCQGSRSTTRGKGLCITFILLRPRRRMKCFSAIVAQITRLCVRQKESRSDIAIVERWPVLTLNLILMFENGIEWHIVNFPHDGLAFALPFPSSPSPN